MERQARRTRRLKRVEIGCFERWRLTDAHVYDPDSRTFASIVQTELSARLRLRVDVELSPLVGLLEN